MKKHVKAIARALRDEKREACRRIAHTDEFNAGRIWAVENLTLAIADILEKQGDEFGFSQRSFVRCEFVEFAWDMRKGESQCLD
jgi:hypothetical protein